MEEYSFCAISDGILPDTVAAEHIRLLRVCYLLKAGFTNPEIVHITEESRQTIFNRSRKIREKMGERLHIPTEKEEKEKEGK